MKIIFSRKGFDKRNGGVASPIFSDGGFPVLINSNAVVNRAHHMKPSSNVIHMCWLGHKMKPKSVDPRYPTLNPKYPLDCLLGHIFECTSTRATPSKENIPDNGPLFACVRARSMPRACRSSTSGASKSIALR